jgi:hypothetical protein
MVKNEADIIESFIRYHAAIVDEMVVVNHFSSDRTVEILEKLVREGLPVRISHAKEVEWNQSQVTTRLAYQAIEEWGADLVLPLDADEFLVAADGSVNPRMLLDQLEERALHIILWRNYFPHASDNPREPVIPRRLVYRVDDGVEQRGKTMLFKSMAQECSPAISMGGHGLVMSRRSRKRFPQRIASALRMAHFPVRSIHQIISKIYVSHLTLLSRYDAKLAQGIHVQKLYAELKKGGSVDVEDMQRMVADAYLVGSPRQFKLIKDPLTAPFLPSLELRYTAADEINILHNVLECSEDLAVKYAKLKKDEHSVSKTAALFVKTLGGYLWQTILRTFLGNKREVDSYHP